MPKHSTVESRHHNLAMIPQDEIAPPAVPMYSGAFGSSPGL